MIRTTRRDFLGSSAGATTALLLGTLHPQWRSHLQAAEQAAADVPMPQIASHEAFWSGIAQAFDIDRSITNLNNGGVSPAPRGVLSAMQRHVAFSNHAPSHNLWRVLTPQVEAVRTQLARAFGCDREEMAITRNASESLQIALCGLDLKPGDEILTTTHDYPRMLNSIRQREAREGIVLRQIELPVPITSHDEIVQRIEQAITPRTRVLLVSHMVFLSGEILPVRQLCDLARSREIVSIVDGAHAFAHFEFRGNDIGCDVYATSLHKWLTAPIGTGFLHVRRELIPRLWPLQAAPEVKAADIRKFEEIGTHAVAPQLAIAEALAFYQGIGPRRKELRLRYLRDRWVTRLSKLDSARILTNLAPEHSCAIANLAIEGIDPKALADHLWERHQIVVAAINHEAFQGIRVTPNVYTTLEEIDRFCDAVEAAIPRLRQRDGS